MQIAALRVQAQKPPRGELQEKYAPVQNRRCSLERSFSKLVKKHICRYHSGMKVMVVGSGGREHAISWALAKSPRVDTVVCVPGNGGTAYETKCVNIDPAAYSCPPQLGELERYVYIATQEGCALAVIGPEAPLAAGLADMLEDAGIPAVGPRKQAAQLEASKDAAKQFMKKYGIACAKSESFRDPEQAHKYIDEQGAPIVIKADGLAAGKGVVVAKTSDEAHAAVRDFMERGSLGSAGATVIIEEYLTGTEISMFAAVCAAPKLTDAARSCITPLMYARDHKRLHDGAQGPNTGGMGAVAPLTDITARQYDDFIQYIYMPTFAGIVAEGWDYRGFLFFGLMLTKDGPKLLEYNVRLGDPETQALLPLLDSDFAELCEGIAGGKLGDCGVSWKQGFVCAPVAVSGGYPGSYQTGKRISIDESCYDTEHVKIFIAGARAADGGQLETSGGRVLAAAAYGAAPQEARSRAYEALGAVLFDGMFYRRDIGLPGAADST